LAQELKVKRIYTGAAFPVPIHHRDQAEVFGAVNKPELRESLLSHGVKIMEGGEISGLNGLLLGYAQERGIEGVCLLATIPVYAVSFPNPRAYKAIVMVLAQLLGIPAGRIDIAQLDSAIFEMEQRLDAIEERMRETITGEAEPEATGPEESAQEVPHYVLERIERLFEQARADQKVAYQLKRELDRWGLFKSYEDRFLDLFKKERQ
jgi:hypothetical protein